MSQRPRFLVPAIVLLHLLPFAVRPALIGGDEPHYALMAHSMAMDGDLALEDDYRAVERGSKAAGKKLAGKELDRHVLPGGGDGVFAHPLGLPLLAAPLLWLQQRVAPGAAPDLVLGLFGLLVTFLAVLAGWRLTAASVGDDRAGAILALGVYFSTPLWFYSRTFFTEPFLWALVVLALWLETRHRTVLAGALLGVSFAIRETTALLILPILLFVSARRGLGRGLRLAGGPALFLLLFLAKNVIVYGAPWVTFQPYRVGSAVDGVLGLLFDPRKGLVFFAPVFLLAIVGWVLPGPRPRLGRDSSRWALLTFVVYFLISAAWIDWRGGSCYGPRLLVPVLPALVWPLARLWRRSAQERWFQVFLGVSLVGGFTVQWCAALDPFAAFWSVPIGSLTTRRPLVTLTGVLLGSALLRFLWPPAPPGGTGLTLQGRDPRPNSRPAL